MSAHSPIIVPVIVRASRCMDHKYIVIYFRWKQTENANHEKRAFYRESNYGTHRYDQQTPGLDSQLHCHALLNGQWGGKDYVVYFI